MTTQNENWPPDAGGQYFLQRLYVAGVTTVVTSLPA